MIFKTPLRLCAIIDTFCLLSGWGELSGVRFKVDNLPLEADLLRIVGASRDGEAYRVVVLGWGACAGDIRIVSSRICEASLSVGDFLDSREVLHWSASISAVVYVLGLPSPILILPRASSVCAIVHV
jgi:hypothetical protein